MCPGLRVKTFQDPRQGERVTRVDKKEKKAQEAAAFSARDPWFCESGDALQGARWGTMVRSRQPQGINGSRGAPGNTL